MILLMHIILALASLIASALAFIAPSKTKLRASYELTSLTIVSGTYLVLHNHLQLVSACLSGLVYLGFVSIMILSARSKLINELSEK